MLNQTIAGSYRLFRLFGINVYVHWSWFIAAYFLIQWRWRSYELPIWNVLEYLGLFAIVLMHEFGHALACRSVGGKAEHIALWPLGGVAFVQPPERPGAVLWSIAAGPLVNVLLAPVLFVAAMALGMADVSPFFGGGGTGQLTDVQRFVSMMFAVNIVILAFNMLPIYPLDGGQILQSLLWFVIGRTRSLHIVAVIGLVAAAAGGMFAVSVGNLWFFVMAMFIGWQSWNGFRIARYLAAREAYEREFGPLP